MCLPIFQTATSSWLTRLSGRNHCAREDQPSADAGLPLHTRLKVRGAPILGLELLQKRSKMCRFDLRSSGDANLSQYRDVLDGIHLLDA